MANRRGPRRPSTRSQKGAYEVNGGLGERILEAHRRAQTRANRRSYRRRGMTQQAAIASSAPAQDVDFLPLTFFRRMLHWTIAFWLLPLCFVTIITLCQQAGNAHTLDSFWRSSEVFYFSIGVCLMTGWLLTGVANYIFLYLYVLGHEMTHAMFVYLCGGRISQMQVGIDGGFIMTNKSNILIALSPYFIPFWSLMLITTFRLLGLFYEIPYSEKILLGLLGATFSFHLIWTVWMIPKDQPDLREHGIFLSLAIIVLANLALLSIMLCVTTPGLGMTEFFWSWWNNFTDLFRTIPALLTRIL